MVGVVRLLLEKRGNEVENTEYVFKAAASDRQGGRDMMELLLKEWGHKIAISNELTAAAAEHREGGEQLLREGQEIMTRTDKPWRVRDSVRRRLLLCSPIELKQVSRVEEANSVSRVENNIMVIIKHMIEAVERCVPAG